MQNDIDVLKGKVNPKGKKYNKGGDIIFIGEEERRPMGNYGATQKQINTKEGVGDKKPF